MSTVLSQEPSSFVAGDTVSWTKSLSDYSASDGWQLSYMLRGSGVLDFSASTSGTGWIVSLSAAQTSGLFPGTYFLQGFLTKADQRVTVFNGQAVIKQNIVNLNGGMDGASFAKKCLTLVEAALLNSLPSEFQNFSINGKSLSRYSKADLFVVRDRLRTEVAREDAASGLGPTGKISVRFNPINGFPPQSGSAFWP